MGNGQGTKIGRIFQFVYHICFTVVIRHLEPKSEARVSKFDWHDLSPIFFDHNGPT